MDDLYQLDEEKERVRASDHPKSQEESEPITITQNKRKQGKETDCRRKPAGKFALSASAWCVRCSYGACSSSSGPTPPDNERPGGLDVMTSGGLSTPRSPPAPAANLHPIRSTCKPPRVRKSSIDFTNPVFSIRPPPRRPRYFASAYALLLIDSERGGKHQTQQLALQKAGGGVRRLPVGLCGTTTAAAWRVDKAVEGASERRFGAVLALLLSVVALCLMAARLRSSLARPPEECCM